jgi:hypothetical protein
MIVLLAAKSKETFSNFTWMVSSELTIDYDLTGIDNVKQVITYFHRLQELPRFG